MSSRWHIRKRSGSLCAEGRAGRSTGRRTGLLLNKERTIPMIQDILPRHLDNQFRWMTPQKSDIILLFEGSSVLAKWQDEKFIILITKNSAHRQMRQNTRLFMYCLSMKSSIFWQCAKEKCWRAAFRESFPMRKCMRNIKAN